MIGIFICCFSILLFCAFTKWRSEEDRNIVYWGLYLILVMIAVNRDERFADYDTYVLMYENLDETFVEPSFVAIASFAQWLTASPWMMFFIYASLGILLKMKAILQMSEFPFFSLLLYFSKSYFLHDMVQIRVSVAIGFMLLSIISLRNKDTKQYFLCLIAAVLFHYSAIVMLSFFFLSREKFNRRLWLIIFSICVFCYLSKFTFTNIVYFLSIDSIKEKLLIYATVKNMVTEDLRLPILRIGLVLTVLIFSRKLCETNRYGVLLIQIYIMSLCANILFCDVTGMAERLGDFFAVVSIILVPMLIKIIQPRWLGYLFIIIISVYIFYMSMTTRDLILNI